MGRLAWMKALTVTDTSSGSVHSGMAVATTCTSRSTMPWIRKRVGHKPGQPGSDDEGCPRQELETRDQVHDASQDSAPAA